MKALLIAVSAMAAAYLVSKLADEVAQASEDGTTAIDYFDAYGWMEAMLTSGAIQQAVTDRNVKAFIEMIAEAEGTASAPDPYRVCFGYRHTIRSFTDHPAVTKEWLGEKLSDKQCAGAGKGQGCVSTAAGKGQIIKPTWLRIKRALALPDFSPASQDAAIVFLVDEAGALDDVKAGRITQAMDKCRRVWASFPAAGYDGQKERSRGYMLAAFDAAGGVRA